MNIENEDQYPNSNYENNKKLGLRIKALELAVELAVKVKGSSSTSDDLLKLACYLYDFLDDDILISSRKLGLYK